MKSQTIETKSHIKEKPSKEVKKLIEEANQLVTSAETKIRAAYAHATKVDKLEPRVAARILYDNLKYSPQWIKKFLPDEAIQKSKGRTASNIRRGIKNRKIVLGTLTKAGRIKDDVSEAEVIITVPAQKFKQFLLGLIDIQEKAQKFGVLIHKDLTVELISS